MSGGGEGGGGGGGGVGIVELSSQENEVEEVEDGGMGAGAGSSSDAGAGSSSAAAAPLPVSATVKKAVPESIQSMFEFQVVWKDVDAETDVAWEVLQMVDPAQYKAFFNTQLTEPIFLKMVDTLSHALSRHGVESAGAFAASVLDHIVTVPRFSMIAMFLPSSSKATLSTIADTLRPSSTPLSTSTLSMFGLQ